MLGSVVWAEVCEPSGTPAGEHPALVLSPQAGIDAGLDLRVVVISTSFSYPLPSGWYDMPARPGGHEITGLEEACVVKATWPQRMPQSAVRKCSPYPGPARIYKQVLA